MTNTVSIGRTFARTLAAEWKRMWTVKATWWFLIAAAVVLLGIGLIAGIDASSDSTPPNGEPAWQILQVAALPAQFALLALALTAVASDYATGGIVPTLQWTPRRSVLFFARALVAIAVATGIGVLLGIGSAVVAYLVSQQVLSLPFDEGFDLVGTVAFIFATGAALSAGLAFVLRNTAGALISVFLLMLILPLLLPVFGYDWLTAIAEKLPGAGALYLLTEEVPEGMTDTSSIVVLLAWAGGALLLGWLRLVRDDANR